MIGSLQADRYNWLKNYEGLLPKLVLEMITELNPVPYHNSSTFWGLDTSDIWLQTSF